MSLRDAGGCWLRGCSGNWAGARVLRTSGGCFVGQGSEAAALAEDANVYKGRALDFAVKIYNHRLEST
jgi:hypothetical protein